MLDFLRLLCSSAVFLGFNILGEIFDICDCCIDSMIEVVTFCLHG